MALTSLRQRKRKADVVKKCTQKLMEPKPCFGGLTRALTTYDVHNIHVRYVLQMLHGMMFSMYAQPPQDV